ncbi:unnamed protein product, partial [marine sediment metagenome]
TGNRAALYTSDIGFESYFYIGSLRTKAGKEILEHVITSNALRKYYEVRERERAELKSIATTFDKKDKDRAIIPVFGNINVPYHLRKGDFGIQEEGALGRLKRIYEHGANGIALGRTEYVYTRGKAPDLETQKDLYLGMADFSKRPITLRTFDKRNDKECVALPGVGREYSFDYYRTEPGRDALKTQVKAILIAQT